MIPGLQVIPVRKTIKFFIVKPITMTTEVGGNFEYQCQLTFTVQTIMRPNLTMLNIYVCPNSQVSFRSTFIFTAFIFTASIKMKTNLSTHNGEWKNFIHNMSIYPHSCLYFMATFSTGNQGFLHSLFWPPSWLIQTCSVANNSNKTTRSLIMFVNG